MKDDWGWDARHGWLREFCRLCTTGLSGMVFVALVPLGMLVIGAAVAAVALDLLAAVARLR